MELEIQYNILGLSKYYYYAIQLLQLCCKDSDIRVVKDTGQIKINDEIITPEIFDDLRRIIIIQGNMELEIQYNILGLSKYYYYAIQLLQLCCKDSDIRVVKDTGQIKINDEIITPEIFDDLRRIIIIQNDIDFDIDEFINYDTEQRLLKARKDINKNEDSVNIEDYIDSLVIAMHVTEKYVMNMTIRKFWRYIKRYNLHETYTIAKTGECSGFVKFNEPIKHWMRSIDDDDDKYKNLKTDESELKSKVI
ncbi:hypothetical protein FMM80_00870 [Schaedlerella arabinosiphila]|uniref:Uncharacterized protein n=2 Tax=Schaedlerella arabinosiphila TaxID=2044587 RepID=A0A9X5H4W1_9FIRM|nr:hypothetical protein [Schaedlerella arabinosiphila]